MVSLVFFRQNLSGRHDLLMVFVKLQQRSRELTASIGYDGLVREGGDLSQDGNKFTAARSCEDCNLEIDLS